jgi:hypothetical protein
MFLGVKLFCYSQYGVAIEFTFINLGGLNATEGEKRRGVNARSYVEIPAGGFGVCNMTVRRRWGGGGSNRVP